MARIVMKFGGTSMAGSERIRRVANIVRRQQAAGHEVAVVVSAMAGETDRLVGFCREADALYDPAEYDVVVASGEQVTAGLLAMTLQAMGCKARSWLGWQLPVKTDDAHAKHFQDFFDNARKGTQTTRQDPVFGFRAAAPALACNLSYFGNKIINWDPVEMKVKKR